jgi:predicted nucleic-acid-binding protein
MSVDKKLLFNIISNIITISLNPSSTIIDISNIILSPLSKYIEKKELELESTKKLLEEQLSQIPENQIMSPDIQIAEQELFNQLNITFPYLLDTDKEKIMRYIDIYQSFDMKHISNVTTQKCIIDPLGNPISDIGNIRIDVSEVNDWMLNELNKNPTDLYQLSSRRFEELVAELLIRKGYNVELTPATRDGGKDIYAARKDDLGSFLYIVECKKYKPTHKVGVNVLRDLYGVLSKEKATYGVAVTTSYFSKPAQDFQQELQFQMSLQDFDSIKQWLCDVTHNNIIT